jgi:GLPGLI family protein
MKNLFILLLIAAPLFLIAQNEGEIRYDETIKMEIDLPEGQEHLRAMIPSERTSQKVLYDEETIEHNSEDGNVQVKMVIATPDNKTYRNLETGDITTQQEFFGKKFLIKGDKTKYEWKMTTEQKKIGAYTCMKAELKDTSRTVIAWFTPQIPTSIGPGGFGQLPGMILEIDINDGQQKITANKIEMRKLDADEIVKPEKGKDVTREEFDKISEEKMKEMEEEMGGSGMRIRIGN